MSALAPIGLAVFGVASAGMVRYTLQIGSDEHYEVTKGLLLANGYAVYRQLWDDQPPLYSLLLSLCFKGFGSSIGVARALAVCFGSSLLAACWVLVKRRCETIAAAVATVVLLAAPCVFDLSVSVMLEVPAIGTALWALWPLLRWQRSARVVSPTEGLSTPVPLVPQVAPAPRPSPPLGERVWWLVLSGLIFAAALQIKLTAAVSAPALLVEILLGCQGATWAAWARQSLRSLALWSASLVGTYLTLAAMLGHVPWDVLWASHFSAKTLARGENVAFSPRLVLADTEALWAGGAGLLVVALRRDWRRMAFPLVLLLTVTVVHLNHRPWWPYYYLHFAVPLAWVSGYGIGELVRLAWNKAGEPVLRARLLGYGCLGTASLLLGLMAAYGGDRLLSEVERIRALPRVEESALVAKMKQYANCTRWVYTRQTIYPFHAGLLVVPELAVLPAKRFWSGQITEDNILAVVKRYQPEQLLLSNEPSNQGIQTFVKANYALVYQDGETSLYVRNLPEGQ